MNSTRSAPSNKWVALFFPPCVPDGYRCPGESANGAEAVYRSGWFVGLAQDVPQFAIEPRNGAVERIPVADVCRWFGHSPAVAARFYAQARSEVAEKASREPTIFAAKEGSQVGSIAGDIEAETGSKSGDITIRQEGGQKCPEM
jgi:hypothetical protein